MEQFSEIVFSKRPDSSFRLVRRNALDLDLLAKLIQEILTGLTVYIGKRPMSFKKLDIILHDEFHPTCLGRARFLVFAEMPVCIELFVKNHATIDSALSTFLHELAHSMLNYHVRHSHEWLETTALLFTLTEKNLERPTSTNIIILDTVYYRHKLLLFK